MAEWETAPSSDWETAPVTANPKLREQGIKSEDIRAASAVLNQRDTGIDYSSGVDNAGFRANFSRMDNPAEREKFLSKEVGTGNWGKDSYGAYYIKPKGLEKLGMSAVKPISIDEQITTRYDIADWAGDLPAIVGSTGMALTATGAGAIPGIALTALGGAGGYGFSEAVKSIRGEQVKSPGEIGIGLAKEGALAGLGEGVSRILSPIAKFALGPGASRMTPEKKALADSAIEQGFKIRPGAVTDAPILARWEGMVRNIFGDLYAERNEIAAKKGLDRLTSMAGQKNSPEVVGEILSSAIRQERTAFGAKMSQQYAKVDELVGGRPIVPTQPTKDVATKILSAMPKTADGKVIGGKDAFARDILEMGSHMTVENAQRLRTMLREASESPDLVPDVSMHDARSLYKSVNDSFEAAKDSPSKLVPPARQKEAIEKLAAADREYAAGIRKFDNPTVARITKDANRSGSVDPEMVVEYLIKPDRAVRVRRVKDIVAPDVWEKVKSAHAQDLTETLVKGTADPLVSVFDGRAFRDTLEKYGRTVLEEVHGKPWVDAAYGYANALMLSEKKMGMSGGIVAANIALHPIKNMPKLLWLRGVAKLMEQPGTFKYLTEGVKLGPSTIAGAKALSKITAQATVLANDETGSARITFTDPEK